MSRQLGTTFSIPITVTSTSGSVVHIRPLPSDSKTQTLPVSATAKFAPLTPIRADRNFAPQVQPRRLGERRRARRSGPSRPSSRAEDVADLGAVPVDRRHEDVRREVVVELDDQLGEVGLHREDAGRGERARSARSRRWRSTSPSPPRPPRATRAIAATIEHASVAVLRPVHHRRRRRPRPPRAARGGRSSREQRGVLDRRARRTQLLPVRQLLHDTAALVADRRGGPRQVARAAGCRRARAGPPRGSRSRPRLVLGRGEDLRQVHGPHARSAARQRRRRCASGTTSPRRTPPRRRVSSTSRTLSASIAVDTSAFFTANVPPKPQHSTRIRQLDQLDPAHRPQQAQRPLAHAQRAQRVAGRVVGDPVRVVRAHVLDAEHVHEELGQLVDAAARPRRAARAPSPRRMPTASRPPRTRRTRPQAGAPARAPRRRSRCSGASARSRSAPRGNSTSHAEPLQQPHDRLARLTGRACRRGR